MDYDLETILDEADGDIDEDLDELDDLFGRFA